MKYKYQINPPNETLVYCIECHDEAPIWAMYNNVCNICNTQKLMEQDEIDRSNKIESRLTKIY